MSTVTVADAKARLSDLLAQVEAGEGAVITRRGQPVARFRSFPGIKIPNHYRSSLFFWP